MRWGWGGKALVTIFRSTGRRRKVEKKSLWQRRRTEREDNAFKWGLFTLLGKGKSPSLSSRGGWKESGEIVSEGNKVKGESTEKMLSEPNIPAPTAWTRNSVSHVGPKEKKMARESCYRGRGRREGGDERRHRKGRRYYLQMIRRRTSRAEPFFVQESKVAGKVGKGT